MDQPVQATGAAAAGPWILAVALLAWACGSLPAAAAAPQLPRDGWKDCAFNGVTIGCLDHQLPTGLRLVWKDGLRMTYTESQPRRAGDPVLLRDQIGGLWQREVLAQGNTVLSHSGSGVRIVIPLRFPCRPPLRGEVGYCRD